MSSKIRADAAGATPAPLPPFEYEPGLLGADQIGIAISYRGVCRPNPSMPDNGGAMSAPPPVPGHEGAGHVTAVGVPVKTREPVEQVGPG